MLLLQDYEVQSIVGGNAGVITHQEVNIGGYEGIAPVQNLTVVPANSQAYGDGSGKFTLIPNGNAFDAYANAMTNAFG